MIYILIYKNINELILDILGEKYLSQVDSSLNKILKDYDIVYGNNNIYLLMKR